MSKLEERDTAATGGCHHNVCVCGVMRLTMIAIVTWVEQV